MSKLDTTLKSFKLSEGKSSMFYIGLILIVALLFVGLALWAWREMDEESNNGLEISNSSVSVTKEAMKEQLKEIEASRDKNELLPLTEEGIQRQIQEMEIFKNNSALPSEKEIQEQLKELERLRQK